MNKQLITTQLEQFGLDQVETVLYVHLLERGPKTPLDLSRETSVNRSRIYRYLDRLKAKKLIEEVNLGRGIVLKASNPKNLELLIIEKEQEVKNQKENLTSLLTELTSFQVSQYKGISIKQYHGIEGLKQMLWNHLSAKKEILVFGYGNRNDIAGNAFAEDVRFEQVERKITKIEIENETDQGNYWYTKVPNWGSFYKSRYIPTRILDIKQYQVIFDDTVSILSWTSGVKVGLEIENAPFAKMYKQIFWKFWDIAKDYASEAKRLEKSKKRKPI